MALEGRVEYALDERGLTTSRDTCDNRHDVEGKVNSNTLEIVHTRALDSHLTIPWTTALGKCYLVQMGEVTEGVTTPDD